VTVPKSKEEAMEMARALEVYLAGLEVCFDRVAILEVFDDYCCSCGSQDMCYCDWPGTPLD
jgi:hypothetical protein